MLSKITEQPRRVNSCGVWEHNCLFVASNNSHILDISCYLMDFAYKILNFQLFAAQYANFEFLMCRSTLWVKLKMP